MDWTDEEIELAAIYGTCDFCGGPRTTRTERTEQTETMLLVCARCGREAT